MNKYEEISPKAAKWILPYGTMTDAMPVAVVARGGAIFKSDDIPDDSIGKLGDFYITREGIYTKKII